MTGEMLTLDGIDGQFQAYLARPAVQESRPAVIVIHEIFGLSDHIKTVADHFAELGYVALAPNLFSRPGLAEVMLPPNISETFRFMNTVQRERLSDQVYLLAELGKLEPEKRAAVQITLPMLMGGIPKDRLTLDLIQAVTYLNAQSFVSNGKIASVGFCFGGGMSINLACQADLAACVVFYGENPSPIEQVQNIACPVLGIYGAEDTRINIRLDELVHAMVEYRKDFEMKIYTGAAHAFFNPTNLNGYRPMQAADAWDRVIAFYLHNLE